MSTNSITLKLEIGALLTVIYALLSLLSQQFQLLPGVVGLGAMYMLPIVYGLLFGRTGAFACALGGVFADVASGAFSPLSLGGFLGAYTAALLPYRIWQGMRSEREENFILGTPRTNIMFLVLAFTAAVPPALVLPLFADRFGLAPYTLAFSRTALTSVAFSLLGGFILYKYFSPRFLEGKNHDLWLQIKDVKTSTRPLSVALLRLTFTAMFLGLGFWAMMEPTMGQEVIMYPMGGLALVILLLVNW